MNGIEAINSLSTALNTFTNATIEYYRRLAASLQGTLGYSNMSADQILNERLRESGKTSLGGDAGVPLATSYFQDLATQLVSSSSYAGMNVGQIANERARESGNASVNVNLNVSSPSGDRFAQMMAESIQLADRSGYSISANGGLP
jgi:hypothetical protein